MIICTNKEKCCGIDCCGGALQDGSECPYAVKLEEIYLNNKVEEFEAAMNAYDKAMKEHIIKDKAEYEKHKNEEKL